MNSASLSSYTFSCRPFSAIKSKSPLLTFKNVFVKACCEKNGRDHGGSRLVDENMILLRMRIRDMNKLEQKTEHAPPSHWKEWEKEYYTTNYASDIYEAVGLLQCLLMNTRPGLALGMAALIALSVLISTGVVTLQVLEVTNKLLSGFSSSILALVRLGFMYISSC